MNITDRIPFVSFDCDCVQEPSTDISVGLLHVQKLTNRVLFISENRKTYFITIILDAQFVFHFSLLTFDRNIFQTDTYSENYAKDALRKMFRTPRKVSIKLVRIK
jgi:hypothetical protein